MTTIRYCTPEWLGKSAEIYRATDRFKESLRKVTTKIFFKITAEPAWGIDEDIIFGCVVEAGELLELAFYSHAQASEMAEFILSATPQEWKHLLRKEKKFITEFMLGKIPLEYGSKVGILKIAPYADYFVDALTQFELQYPDEMSPDEVEAYRAYMQTFREELGV